MESDKVDPWIESTYRTEGVPSSQFYAAVSHFGNGRVVTPYVLENSGKTYHNAIVAISNGHAVNVSNVVGNTIYYWDYQNNWPGKTDTYSITQGFIYN